MSEKKIDIYDCEKSLEKFGPGLPIDQIKVLARYLKEIYPSKEKYRETNTKIIEAGKKIKILMKQIIEGQKKVQTELLNYGRCIGDYIYLSSNLKVIEALTRLSSYFCCFPELSDSAIYQIKDTDFEATT